MLLCADTEALGVLALARLLRLPEDGRAAGILPGADAGVLLAPPTCLLRPLLAVLVAAVAVTELCSSRRWPRLACCGAAGKRAPRTTTPSTSVPAAAADKATAQAGSCFDGRRGACRGCRWLPPPPASLLDSKTGLVTTDDVSRPKGAGVTVAI